MMLRIAFSNGGGVEIYPPESYAGPDQIMHYGALCGMAAHLTALVHAGDMQAVAAHEQVTRRAVEYYVNMWGSAWSGSM